MVMTTIIAICTAIKVISSVLLSIKRIGLEHSYLISIATMPPFIAHNYLIGEYVQMGYFICLIFMCMIGWYNWRKG